MKKGIITCILALATLVSAWAASPLKLESLIRQYKGEPGFETISMGPVALSLLRGAATVSAGSMTEQDRLALKVFDGIKKLIIVDFEDAAPSVKTRFSEKLEKQFEGMELILEAHEDGEKMRIYGVEEGGRLKDCVLYSSDGVFLYARGSIDMQYVGELMELAQ